MSKTWVVGSEFANGNFDTKEIHNFPATVIKVRVMAYFHQKKFYGLCPDSASKGKKVMILDGEIKKLPQPFPIKNQKTIMLLDLFVKDLEFISMLVPLGANFNFNHAKDLTPERLREQAYELNYMIDQKYPFASISEPKFAIITVLNGDLVIKC